MAVWMVHLLKTDSLQIFKSQNELLFELRRQQKADEKETYKELQIFAWFFFLTPLMECVK